MKSFQGPVLFFIYVLLPLVSPANNPASAISEAFTLDVKNPVVSISSPTAGQEIKNNQPLQVAWTAIDDNLGDQPISISMIIVPASQTHSLLENTGNSGAAQVALPVITSNQAIVRISATDLFGNVGTAETAGYVTLVDGTVDVEEIELSDKLVLKAYPNPAQNQIWVEFTKTSPENQTLYLINMAGQVLASQTIHNTGQIKTSFTVDGLQHGLYILKLDTHVGFAVDKILIR
jgi:hypothetical protein